ncbi:hypothetical protein GGG16DRAFT_118053 [Schizophyllum commune]
MRAADIHSQTDTQHLEAFFRRPATGIRPLPTCSGADLCTDRTHANYRLCTSDLAYRWRRARPPSTTRGGRGVDEVAEDVAEGEDTARGIEEGLEAVGEVAGDDIAEGRGGVAEVVKVDSDAGQGR